MNSYQSYQNPSCYSVYLGLTNRANPEMWSILKSVSAVIVHQNYDPKTIKNDIALLKLSVSYNCYLL